ncbi:MAG: MauE/DoxX family redox-associated membrane protein [bacterium]
MNTGCKKWMAIILRFGFGILFLYSSYHKILHPWEFSFDVENYRIVGEGLSRLIAVWIPYLELIVALLLISGIWLKEAILMNYLLMQLFFILVIQAYIRGLDINCGCFHTGGEGTIGPVKIIENLIFLGLSVVLLLLHENFLSTRKIK